MRPHPFRASTSRLVVPLLLVALVVTALIYWPGLHGGYTFDDYPNIVNNEAVHVSDGTPGEWWRAANASPSRELKRALAMFSFAVNHRFSGMDPFWFKLTNLGLHLINGLLLFVVLRKLLHLWRRQQGNANAQADVLNEQQADLLALAVACAWLVAPINLTGVLYVVQRMTGLAQLFILGGLWLYTHGRARQLDGGDGWPWLVAGLLCVPILGLSAKETTILVPAFALACELALFGFRDACGRPSRALITGFAFLIGVPLALAIGWLLPGLQGSYNGRPFTMTERLLTEYRVLIQYVQWTLLPSPGALSFYHDDIMPSRGWLSPPTTALCATVLAGMVAVAFACLRYAPLIGLGLLWFFAGHLLESTVLPLELVFEHRNYFASAGLLLAAMAVLIRLGRHFNLRLPAYALMAVLVTWSATVTAMRSLEWSHPLRMTASQALANPQSPRAQYEYGRSLVIASGHDPASPLLQEARKVLERAASLPGARILPDIALITMAGHTGAQTRSEWWQRAITTLRQRPAQVEETNAIHSVLKCQLEGPCPHATRKTLELYLAALEHSPGNSALLTSYAQFAAYQLGDRELARRIAHEALARSHDREATRETLAPILTPNTAPPSMHR